MAAEHYDPASEFIIGSDDDEAGCESPLDRSPASKSR
jgi:hypothetical protein